MYIYIHTIFDGAATGGERTPPLDRHRHRRGPLAAKRSEKGEVLLSMIMRVLILILILIVIIIRSSGNSNNSNNTSNINNTSTSRGPSAAKQGVGRK